MKLNGFVGTGSGKLGSSVFSVNSGEQIVRQYQPQVTNPSTEAQVQQRARLKLMSQLAASLAPVIAIPKSGMVSKRNKFISKNFASSYSNGGQASITLENVQLTEGNAGLPQITASREGSVLSLALAENSGASVSRVVYSIFRKNSEAQLQLVDSQVVTEAGDGGTFPATIQNADGEVVIFAYGMKDLNAAATAHYNNMQCNSGVDVATLVATRNISTSDYQFTKTRGATMDAAGNPIDAVPEGKARVYLTASGEGSVSGAGTFDLNSQVTVRATPAAGSNFSGWKNNGATGYVSTSREYTFTLLQTIDLVAVFTTPTPGDDNSGLNEG